MKKGERWKRGKEKIVVDTPLFLLYFSFIHLFISLDFLYFRSRSCNGFTSLCFLIDQILLRNVWFTILIYLFKYILNK